ncbi:vacuolar protein 14 C-terminal Fig4p binding-domain-containing protein [Suillus spraguei]|nr:vacuolar protein 14 C-terminal Fig4p binding-domain-containing protein [Suillus spraguei]
MRLQCFHCVCLHRLTSMDQICYPSFYASADLEITVPLLIQVDKLVQLIESPVFTYLRLQLLEPERYPYFYKKRTLYAFKRS